jgi:hypothetical protein
VRVETYAAERIEERRSAEGDASTAWTVGVGQPGATRPPRMGMEVSEAGQTGGDASATSLGAVAMVSRAVSEPSSSTAGGGVPRRRGRAHPRPWSG